MALILRTVQGTPLTFQEGDDNLKWLESGTVSSVIYDSASSSLIFNRLTSSGNWATSSVLIPSSNFYPNLFIGSNTTTSSGNWQITSSQGDLLFQYWSTGSNTWITDTYLSPTGLVVVSGSVTSASYAETASYVNTLNQNVYITGSLEVTTGATGTFTSQDGKTITVTGGIITSIV
jgi:hypothetical protein